MAWTAPRTFVDGELENAAIFNVHLRDNLLAVGPHLIARKASNETVTSSTVMQADNDLILPVGTTDAWQFEFSLWVTADPAGDIAMRFTFPASGTFAAHSVGGLQSTIDFHQFGATTSPTSTRTTQVTSATNPDYIAVRGMYLGGGTSGNVALEWAQGTSNGVATTVRANSALWAVKLA
jgi:hypothetical protein